MALTVGEKNDCADEARSKGISFCEIFDRERLRIALDSPDGFSVRFQYLRCAVAEEQASFFARWGDESTRSSRQVSRGSVHPRSTLFLQELLGTPHHSVISFELDRTYPGEEIGHFRAFATCV